jgi:iron complex transport system ATP-binding protein
MESPLLTFDQVSFQYRESAQSVFNNLSLSIAPGTITAILGPNGVGKSTLLALALGWRKPQAGRVLLAGRPLNAYSTGELGRWMGLVPQSEDPRFEYSLLEYVLLGRAPHLHPLEMPAEADYQAAHEALETVGMAHMQGRSITTLSGGERQLVLVARTLAQKPRLLMLDEPTSHLDLNNKIRLLNILRSLVEQGISVLLTTHEPEVAAAVATHLVLMRAGQVQHAGKLEDEFTTGLLSETYGVPVQVLRADGRRFIIWGLDENLPAKVNLE